MQGRGRIYIDMFGTLVWDGAGTWPHKVTPPAMPVALFDARDGRNVFLMLRRRWAPGRRRCRDAGAMPLPQLLAARRAAALHNAAIVDVLLGLEGVWAGLSILRPWSVRRWLQLRATCTTARDALPLLLQEDTLTVHAPLVLLSKKRKQKRSGADTNIVTASWRPGVLFGVPGSNLLVQP